MGNQEDDEERVGVHQPEINGRDASWWGRVDEEHQPTQSRRKANQQVGNPAQSPPADEKSDEKVGHYQERQSADQTGQVIGQYQR